MPIYQCISREGRLDGSAREQLAEQITRIHCDARLTGQPEEELLITLWESPAENAMESGAIFPEIGQE